MTTKSHKTTPTPADRRDELLGRIQALIARVGDDETSTREAILAGIAPDLAASRVEREALADLAATHQARLTRTLALLESEAWAAYSPLTVQHVVTARGLTTTMVKTLRDIPEQLRKAELRADHLSGSPHQMQGEAASIRYEITSAGRPSQDFPGWLEALERELQGIAECGTQGKVTRPGTIVEPTEAPASREVASVIQ